MYKNIKSNVTVNNNSSAFFPCQTGVRQGENISPFLFSIFLNDLEMFLLSRNVQGITCDINYDEISVYTKLLVLLFADDTVLFGSSQSELQHALNQFEKYCEEMQLTVNTAKTKVIIFTNKRNIQQSTLTFQLYKKNTHVQAIKVFQVIHIKKERKLTDKTVNAGQDSGLVGDVTQSDVCP